jgi:glyoxylase-like metal-dependent hydrolase (beta-lactamase superfamily II)
METNRTDVARARGVQLRQLLLFWRGSAGRSGCHAMTPYFLRLLKAGAAAFLMFGSTALAQINTVHTVAPGVYFHEGDPRRGHSNNGWIILDDYVLVIDGNYPSGANIVLPKIKDTTEKPIRFVFNTHHHADHAYGNQVWADTGATLVASAGVLDEMKRVETGYFGNAPGRWEKSAKTRPDVAASHLKPPSVLFPKDLFFEDSHHRVELRWFGVAHTRGDAMAWLPKEKILFTGDVCVNGPQNNVADGDIGEWIKTLERLKQLGAEKVCPGHGPMGGPEVLEDQQRYFIELQRQVKALFDARKSPAEVKAAAPLIAAELKKIASIARYVPVSLIVPMQKVYLELGGAPFPSS